MAAKTKLEKRQARKERLIKQNDLYRRDLMAEEDHLRDGVELIERGRGFYQAANRFKLLVSPLLLFRSRKGEQRSKLWSGIRFIQNFRNR